MIELMINTAKVSLILSVRLELEMVALVLNIGEFALQESPRSIVY